jgi:hypothetical protein
VSEDGNIDRLRTRRGVLAGGAALALCGGTFGAHAQQVMKDIRDLKPGEFTWHPERSPVGPVAVIASIPEQLVHVYRNGVRIAVSTCSTGKPGHGTPTGVFVVLQKDKHHRSSTYGGAPMPNMNRLTWDGIALHAGKLPGYPASHGCVRLPFAFSERLFAITHIGTPVIIAGSKSDPWELTHPGLVLGTAAQGDLAEAVADLKGKKHPSDWNDGRRAPITTVVASSASRAIILLEDGREIATGRLDINGSPMLGEHVFILRGAEAQGQALAWQGITHHADPGQPAAREEALLNRLSTSPEFLKQMQARMHPGMVMAVTDLPSHPESRTGADFVVMAGDNT